MSDRIIVAATMGILLVVTLPRLPEGICFGDSGGLQLASATLGITHPPGYGVFATLGYLLTRVPGVDPAFVVTLACLASGLGAILVCILFQVRLGVPAAVACAVGMGLSAQPRIWSNLIAPEVYAPALLFLAGAAYLLFKFECCGKRRDLLMGALCFGLALANRPPVCFALPVFVIALVVSLRRLRKCRRESAMLTMIAAGVAIAPMTYGFCYLWLRDAPNTPFNYIEQYNAETHVLPDASEGAGAKWERVVWIASGQQFRGRMGTSWHRVRQKLTRWLPNELASNRIADLTFGRFPIWGSKMVGVLSCAFTLAGVGLVFRRSGAAGWSLVGMGLGSLAFVSVYRVYGDAANILPLLFIMAVTLGVVLSSSGNRREQGALLCNGSTPLNPPLARGEAGNRRDTKSEPALRGRLRTWAGGILLAMAAVYTLVDAPNRANSGQGVDATGFVEALDMNSLPAHTILCSTWKHSPPLWYAQIVLTGRRDVTIINAASSAWARMVSELVNENQMPKDDGETSSWKPSRTRFPGSIPESGGERLVLATTRPTNWDGVVVTPYRNLWRVSLPSNED